MKHNYYLLLIGLICFLFGISNVNASNYNAGIDVTYSTYENRLFNLAVNNGLEIKDKLIIFRSDNYNYYLIYSDNIELTGNSLKMANSKVLHYYRYDNYNSTWYFDVTDDPNAIISLNAYSLGNIKDSKYIFSFNDLQDYTYKYYSILFFMMIVILLFFRCFRK